MIRQKTNRRSSSRKRHLGSTMEIGKLAHSHSQPGGIDRTPPGTPKKGGKMLAVRVQMLDDTVTMFQVQAKALGRVLFDQVCNQLNLLESDYFGLEYQETGGTKYWLDLEKPLCRQIGLSLVDTLVRFCVKFYTPDPSQLEEEFTRYLFCLQIKRDLSQGLLQCNSNTAALMASYIVQAECGDYVVEDYPDHQYLSSYKFVPNQDQELERRIMENHKKHAGQSPAEADLNLLETARRCELYGIKMHPAKDHEGCPLNLAVAHMGIVVFQNFSKINTFSWAKMRKISFKRKKFLVKLHPEGYGYYKDTVEFFFEGRNECKNFWKKCVENHGFFRCTMVKKVPRQKTRVLSRGSSFRYSGRTQKQIVDFVRENYVKRQTFQRSQSFRHSSSAHSSVANVGTSISAHPLLPLGDNAVAGTPASLSCGSMTLTSSPVHTADIHAGASPSPPLTTSVSPGTSVTSSPQHFYPQETSYRRADHRLTKMKHPPARSHHAISPLNLADAAPAANNRSANHSNNILIVDSNDVISSRNSLKSPDFVDFNDVYSNCYTSLRSLKNAVDDKIVSEITKTDIFSMPCDFSDTANKNKGSIGSLSQKTKFPFPVDSVDVHKYTWHRSASCKELYHETNIETENEKENSIMEVIGPYESAINRYDKSIRKCYSAVTSKNPSIDRTGNVGSDMRIFSRSYPGTTSSLSVESAEGELDDRIVEVLNVKYDSQEEMALSHDDVSHDSYELLERELTDYNDEPSRNKRSRIIGDNERTRSCSWGSEKGISVLDFRSSENVVGSSRDKNFWSLEREKSLKHKSEIDFRSFNHKNLKGSRQTIYEFEGNICDGIERKGRTPEILDRDNRFRKRSREMNEEQFETVNRKNQLDKRVFNSKSFGDKEFSKGNYQELKLRRLSREDRENVEGFEKKRHQCRRKSFEELGAFTMGSQEFSKEIGKMEEIKRIERRRDKREKEERFHEGFKEEQKEWEREKERRLVDRRKSIEENDSRGEKEPSRKVLLKSSDYANFQEIHFKKFERVVSNQFGKYPEFSTSEKTCEFLMEEKKVMENYEKMRQVGRLARELKKNDNFISENAFSDKSQENNHRTSKQDLNNFSQSSECQLWKNLVTANPKVGRAHVERTKSDPYNILKLQKRNILIHQKSIDLTPQQSEETASDNDNDEGLKKASRSEHDIPYILHKRHCMNGTAKNLGTTFSRSELKTNFEISKALKFSESETKSIKLKTECKNSVDEGAHNNSSSEDFMSLKQKFSCVKVAEAKKAGVQIINLDIKNGKTFFSDPKTEPRKIGKTFKSPSSKKPVTLEIKSSQKTLLRKETKKIDSLLEQPLELFTEEKKEMINVEKNAKCIIENFAESKENEEPIYAEVCLENIVNDEYSVSPKRSIPPNPPRRISSISQKSSSEMKINKLENKILEKGLPVRKSPLSEKKEPPTKISHSQKTDIFIPLETEEKKETKAVDIFKGLKTSRGAEVAKIQLGSARGKQDPLFSNAIHQRREESLILFARTRLGLSEGSAFASISRQGRMRSPLSQRRAKSLDAPYVSVHSLPPADAFSSKDDTVDGNESYIVDSAVARFEELCKEDSKKDRNVKKCDGEPGNTESEVDSVFTDDLEMENNFKKSIENQSKIDISFPEERVLDGVRCRRLLSKIESVDFIDSEGDLDSSKLAESLPIPSDRLVNLPESIRFPSVRQISGQTSEESADGWDQREVKVKRRTPRRSVGRDEQETRAKESVAWDSKDDEPPDDDVWDDNLVAVGKYEGVVVNVGFPTEYLKRGSCGQSIDDDNLSTPMKESSPEHWVSVDDLPEALEREEKLLKQQEKLLREKILNEKLKRELNLDTISVDERYCEYKDSLKQSRYDEESTSLKENLKGLSLDTYELNEKKLKEKRGNKNSSLDEELLPNKLISSPNVKEKPYVKLSNYQKKMDYIQCKVVKDVAEIDQFGDNDEELEEFFVVLDENLGKERRSMIWDDDDTFRRTLSNDESLISVPEEFKDFEKEDDDFRIDVKSSFEGPVGATVEIRLNEIMNKNGKLLEDEGISSEKIFGDFEKEDTLSEEKKECTLKEISLEDFKHDLTSDMGRLSPYEGSRRNSEENRKLSLSDDTGRLSPYDSSSRRSSNDPRRFSASEDADRLSPFNDSRRGSEDRRRLSGSEDSRKCSVSESVSEETRRRLSSTEETRRKRASLTKQCSVGAESLSDEIISGIQEYSLSFEHDEKDVFDSEPTNVEIDAEVVESSVLENKNYFGDYVGKKPQEKANQGRETPQVKHLEVEVSKETLKANEIVEYKTVVESDIHLAPPTSEREPSRETEDSVDYAEGDFKDIIETIKEEDISEELVCDYKFVQSIAKQLQRSFEKSESSEADELRYIDDKRGSTPEILLGKNREAVSVSIVVNQGLSVLKKVNEKDRFAEEVVKAQSLHEISPTADVCSGEKRYHKGSSKPKPLTPKPDCAHRKLTKIVSEIKTKDTISPGGENSNKEVVNLHKNSLGSSQESDLDRLNDLTLVSRVQNQIARRNLSDAGKCLRRDEIGGILSAESGERKTSLEDDVLLVSQKTSSEEKEKTDSSSFELKSSADEMIVGEDVKWKETKGEKVVCLKSAIELSKGKREKNYAGGKEKKSPDQEKRDSGEDGSSSSSAPLYPKRELSSTWKPFLLESSGSSSLEEGWLPPDENAHLADEEETSSTSNNQQDDSCHDDIDYPTGVGYPVLNMASAEMMVGGYGGIYALSRTLSRISERSTSEQERSDIEDDITKPSSHSASIEEESIMSSDHQPSLSSDPPSPKESATVIPDLPVDKPVFPILYDTLKKTACQPFEDVIPPPLPEEDWPSPPSSFSTAETPVVSHVETFYMEIHPEEACKIVVAEAHNDGNSSSDENQTLQEESEFLHLSSDNMSASTTTTTQDGTVVIPVRPTGGRTSSLSEDASMVSTSEWSSSTTGKPRPNSNLCTNEDGSERTKNSSRQDWQIAARGPDSCQNDNSIWPTSPSKYCPEDFFDQDLPKPKISVKIKPLKLSSPTGKTFGFFETPVSKVRSPTSQIKFFETREKGAPGYSNLRSPTSFSESTSPKNYGRFFEVPINQISAKSEIHEYRTSRSPTKGKFDQRAICTPYYSNVTDSAEKSYFGHYDTGSLERTKIHSSRKCCSYYSVSKTTPNEGDSSNSDGPPAPSPNTIPRASKKTRRRHKVAMDLVIRNGKIVTPPKTKATVVENSDSDRSSPRERHFKESRKKQSDV